MGILFTVLLIITPCTGIYYILRSGKRNQNSDALLKKYCVLINLLTDRRDAKITSLRPTSMSVTVKMKKDLHILSLSEVDERLIVVWKLQSPRFGKRGKEWSFNPEYSQSRMYSEVLTDIRNYLATARQEKGGQNSGQWSAA